MSSKKKKICLIISIVIIIILLALGAFFLLTQKPKEAKHNVIFSFEDETLKERTIEVNSENFEPDKITVLIDEIDESDLIKIDDSNLDLTKLGTYIVKYYVIHDEKRYEQSQIVKVVDTTPPEITLKGKNITILIGEKFNEPGYKVTDNYDTDLQDKVEITNEIDNTKVGTYKIIYKVADSSGNKSETSREVTVKKPNVVVATPPKETKVEIPKVVETNYENTIKKNKFTSSSIDLEGYIKEPLEANKIKLVGDTTYEYDIEVDNHSYKISINPDNIENGTYKLYINEEKLLNKLNIIERLARAKVGSKLVTFSYDSDEVSIKIEDHAYLYDILINPGHGGSDTGAVNEYIAEKEMNLTVSMYEKCRYEAHGLKVYMTRTSDVYGDKMGPSSLNRLHKVAYEMGYYGAVSKIVYSNHHNSIGNDYYSGYEVLIPAALTSSELSNEITIANKWNNIFDLTENHLRFYARDFDTEKKYAKLNGEVYNFKDNYAVNRIPYQIFNVKSIIYEGCYMSNKNEFLWYWQNDNWYKVSEAKIETYVNSLGITYDSDNSSCL